MSRPKGDKIISVADARTQWRKAYYAAAEMVKLAEALSADYMDDPGIQKFSLLVIAKLLVAQSQVHMVCAAGINGGKA